MIYRYRIYTTARRKTIQLCRNIYNYLSSSKHATLYAIKKSLSVCESEINEEVYVCDREEIMK